MPTMPYILPEVILASAACALFLLGAFVKRGMRTAAPVIAIGTLASVLVLQLVWRPVLAAGGLDATGAIRLGDFTRYVKILTGCVGVVLLLLAWPARTEPRPPKGPARTEPRPPKGPARADSRSRGRRMLSALDVGGDVGEFFALALLSICGVYLVASANDLILLFLGLELVSIPTYVMVSISRPLAVAQEAGVKYFFLGAVAAAIMLLGFSYLYGTTGSIRLDEISAFFQNRKGELAPWQLLAVVMLIVGFAFKIAAVPMHFYAGDVYEGAATPVTAFLAFIPKTSGFVALIKILFVVAGGAWLMPPTIVKLLWMIAVLTMTVGNVLGLLQDSVKRVLAYSSIAHSGYMLTGLAAMAGATGAAGQIDPAVREKGLAGVLFYLAGYGIVNAGAFAVLMLLPARKPQAGTTAETFDDLAGQGRKHVGLGLAMAVSCFSLIGIPLTVGFVGKVLLIRPALEGHLTWLAIITVINAAISAGYYLRIIGAMFLRTPVPPEEGAAAEVAADRPIAVQVALVIAVAGTLLLGIPPAADRLSRKSGVSARVESIAPGGAAAEVGVGQGR